MRTKRFVLFLRGGLDRADHGELSVAKVADIVLNIHDHCAYHGVATEFHPEQCQMVAHVSAGLVVVDYLKDLFEHEDIVTLFRIEVVVDEASVR